jgi:fructoselysine-6-P-deglycase FrlB-like protein
MAQTWGDVGGGVGRTGGTFARMGVLTSTRLWQEALALPETIERTLRAASGLDAVAELVAPAKRLVVTGNGAAYYAALALWLASLENDSAQLPDVVAVPAGLVARGRFAWREGDRLLVVSSSGELRDAIEALEAGAPRPYAAITSSPESPIAAGAGACALVHVASQDALTHTQAFCGNVAAALAVWARVTGDESLAAGLAAAPEAVRAALTEAPPFGVQALQLLDADVPAAIAFGRGPAWAAALEAALLLKEVARIPAEGLETREGATSGMYALAPGHAVLSLPAGPGRDPLLEEAERTCDSAGATVLRAPGGETADRRLAPLTTFPAAVALAIVLGLRAGHDVDRPTWADAYYATARVNEED